jgi:hypothetical protein
VEKLEETLKETANKLAKKANPFLSRLMALQTEQI